MNIYGLTVEKVECIINIITNFFAVVETRFKNDSHNDFSVDGYITQCYNRTSLNPRARRGSGGIALYIREQLVDIREQLVDGVETVSDVNLSLIDDRCGSDYVRISLAWIMTYISECGIFHRQIHVDALKPRICGQFLSHLQGRGDVILMGDFNACTGELKDWIEMDQADKVPHPHEYIFDKDIKPRVSMDKIVNSSGQHVYSYRITNIKWKTRLRWKDYMQEKEVLLIIF